VGRDCLAEAVDVIKIYLSIHTDCTLAASSNWPDLSAEDLLRKFCKLEAVKTGKVSMALERLLEEKAEKARLLSSHGAT